MKTLNGEYIINFETREVISLDGLTVKGTAYYTLEQIQPDYHIQYVNTATTNPEFEINTQYLAQSCRINITNIVFSGYVSTETGTVLYKLHSSPDWIMASGNSFEVYVPGVYDVKLTDNSGNATTKNAYVYAYANLNLYLDGIQNTRNGNSPTVTTWEDLSSNQNDAIGYNMSTESGYYSDGEDGYVFLDNSSYFETTNNIGISGDTTYTVETVVKPYSNYPSMFSSNSILWWGTPEAIEGKSVIVEYNHESGRFCHSFMNQNSLSVNSYNIINTKVYYSTKKVRSGSVEIGNKDTIRMNYNGTPIDTNFVGYNGSGLATIDIVDSHVQVGRCWQFNNENRPFNGVISAVRIYNRALTDEELSVNANIDSQRFGFNL